MLNITAVFDPVYKPIGSNIDKSLLLSKTCVVNVKQGEEHVYFFLFVMYYSDELICFPFPVPLCQPFTPLIQFSHQHFCLYRDLMCLWQFLTSSAPSTCHEKLGI